MSGSRSDPLTLDTKLPKAARWYLDLFTPGKTGREKLGQQGNNLLGLLGAPIALLWALLVAAYDFDGLWPVTLGLLYIMVVVALGPLWYSLGIWVNIAQLALLLSPGYMVLAFLLGSDSGMHLYPLIFPLAQLVLTSLKDWKPLVASTAITVTYVVIGGVVFEDPFLVAADNPLLATVFFAHAVFTVLILSILCGYIVLLRAEKAESALAAEHARSEALLYNLLPESIAARLKTESDTTIADNLPNVAILFADIVDFTPRAASLPPETLVRFLNEIFLEFDALAEKHELEKIKTIGDAYMVAAGMPLACVDPLHRVADMALDMQKTVARMSRASVEGLEVRIGLHAGPAVAGVIGNKKLFYDVWGETVNTASRLESHAEPGRIQVTARARQDLIGRYRFERRGTITIKGMGEVETWWLIGKIHDDPEA